MPVISQQEIDSGFLEKHPECVLVDDQYGSIHNEHPEVNCQLFTTSYIDDAGERKVYKPKEYLSILRDEMSKLLSSVSVFPSTKFIIASLAENTPTLEPMINESLVKLKEYKNVYFIEARSS